MQKLISSKSMPHARWIALFCLFLSIHAVALPQTSAAPKAPSFGGVNTIRSEDLKAHLEFIASDELEGRNTPSRGLRLAEMYIESHLKRWGLKPGGENGTYFQSLHFESSRLLPERGAMAVNGKALEYGADFAAESIPCDFTSGELVYVGYGYEDESRGITPFKEVDVRGKMMVILRGMPPAIEQAIQESEEPKVTWLTPRQTALKYGAKAIIVIYPTGERLDRGGASSRRGGGYRQIARDAVDRVPEISVSKTFLDALCEGENLSSEELLKRLSDRQAGTPYRFSASKPFTLKVSAERSVMESRNVIAIVEGSDPKLKSEYIAIGAHLDHVGMRTGGAPGDDLIFNGADDDGSGSVSLIEMAEAFATGPKPKRSILFVWHTGEEKGLLGARYFMTYPTVPISQIIAQLNIDMIGRTKLPGNDHPADALLSGPDEVYLVGSKKMSTDLGKVSEEVNNRFLKLKFNYHYDDPNDRERIFFRSDHYEYAKKGIPIIFYFSGIHQDYHQVGDEVHKIDFVKMRKVAQTIFATAWTLANNPKRPVVDKPL
ncbi:MAG: M28 family peptidase [Fimbriimonadia bacterium]|nr:M28 family peptidase [Fimbriimonadia bacterium]